MKFKTPSPRARATSSPSTRRPARSSGTTSSPSRRTAPPASPTTSLFTTTFDGTVWALNTKTGKVLWSASSRPAPTHRSRSRATRVITAGSFPQGKTPEGHDRRLPAALVMQLRRSALRSVAALGCLAAVALAVSACGGSGGSSSSSSDSAPTSAPADDEQRRRDHRGGAVTAAAGKKVFTANCGGCHTLADAGRRGSVGPNLDDLKPDMANGRPSGDERRRRDAGIRSQLSDAQIQSVAKYVSSVAGKGGGSGGGGVGGTP